MINLHIFGKKYLIALHLGPEIALAWFLFAFDFCARTLHCHASSCVRYYGDLTGFIFFVRFGRRLEFWMLVMSSSDRKLRSGTRKDYSKMIEGVDVVLNQSADEDNRSDSDDDVYACVDPRNVTKKQNKQQHGQDGGGILNYEVIVGNSDDTESDGDATESDEELREADRKLQALKQQQKLLFK